MRRGLGILLLFTLAACSSPDQTDANPAPSTTPSATAQPSPSAAPSSGRESLVPVVAPVRIQGLRWAKSNLPRGVPEPSEDLPSLLDDPPGRALVASYVPRPDGLGFPGEAIEFYGVDGRWRRLSLGDLDLPPEGWRGLDTYGAGALSPDGRWWAGPMNSGFFLVDLRDGSMQLGDPIGRRYGQVGSASFTWSPDSDELVVLVRSSSHRVSVPDLRRSDFPRPKAYPIRLLADGGWLECTYVRGAASECTTYNRSGSIAEVREVPSDLQRRSAGPKDEYAEDVWFSMPTWLKGNKRGDWEIVLTDPNFQARSRLVLPKGSKINAVELALAPSVLGLAALSDRMLLAYLDDTGEIVRLLRPGLGSLTPQMQDFWDVSFARDLMRIK